MSTELNRGLITDRVNLIGDENLRQLVNDCLGAIPSYFWMKPSSSTGKYHPKDEHLPGGLTLHTCRVVDVVLLICNSRAFDVSRDEAIAAGIIHDVARFGLQVKPAEHSVNNHANQAAWLFTTVASLKDYGIDPEVGARVAQAIGSHMGRWGHPVPETPLDWTVHLADMVAAGYIPVKGEILK